MTYRVFLLGAPLREFPTRDDALRFILSRCSFLGHSAGDYEILDNSDMEA